MGRVPGATSWPTAVVEILVPSQAAACDSPPSIFYSFAIEWMLKNPKMPPLLDFRHCETFSNIFFTKESSVQFFYDLRQKG